MFRLSFKIHLQVVTLGYFNIVSIVYWNIRELQPEDGLKRKAQTGSCHYCLIIIQIYILYKKCCIRLSIYVHF